MDKIGSADGAGFIRYQKEKKTEKKSRADGVSFKDIFSSGSDYEISELFSILDKDVSFEQLIDDLHSAGDELLSKPVTEKIKNYREAVRRFIAYVVKNAYTVEKESDVKIDRKKAPPFNKREIIREKILVIDEKVEKLAAAFIQGQKKQLLILKLEEIEGLLIDLKR